MSQQDLQYSMNSLYTPSYSIGELAVLAPDEPLSLDTQSVFSTGLHSESLVPASTSRFVPTSPRLVPASPSRLVPASPSTSKLQVSGVKPVLPQYQKLKMNYFRKLNVIPIISPEDVLNAKDDAEKVSPEPLSKKKPSLKGPLRLLKEKAKKRDVEDGFSRSGFIPSFLPARNQSSEPMAIPRRASSRSPPSSLSSDEELPQGEREQSLSYVSGARLGAQFSVAEEASPDHFGVFFPSFEL